MKLLVLPLGAAVLLALSACAPATNSPATNPPAAKSSVAPSSGAAPSSSSEPVNVCSRVSLATVASITARSVYTTANEIDGPSEGATLYACEYTDSTDVSDALDGLNLVVYRGGDPDRIMKDLASAQTSGARPHSGIGDRAQLGDGEIDVVVGRDVVVASDSVHEGDLTELTAAQLEKLARLVMGTL